MDENAMTPHEHEDGAVPPSPEPGWLAAHADGELGETERVWVEEWLARDPQAWAELEGQLRVKDWWDQAPVPEPAPAAWDEVRSRIAAALTPTARAPSKAPTGRRRGWTWLAGLAAAAALLLLALWAGRSRTGVPDTPPVAAAEVFPVVEEGDVVVEEMDLADAGALAVGRLAHPEQSPLRPGGTLPVAGPADVTVISMDSGDTSALVVAPPPIAWPLELASAGDVEVDHLAPAPADEQRPYLHAPKGGAPMLIAPGWGPPSGKE